MQLGNQLFVLRLVTGLVVLRLFYINTAEETLFKWPVQSDLPVLASKYGF